MKTKKSVLAPVKTAEKRGRKKVKNPKNFAVMFVMTKDNGRKFLSFCKIKKMTRSALARKLVEKALVKVA